MRVPILGSAGPRDCGARWLVAFEDLDLFEIFYQGSGHRKPAYSGSNHDRTPTQKNTHVFTLRQIPEGQFAVRRYERISAGRQSRYTGNTNRRTDALYRI